MAEEVGYVIKLVPSQFYLGKFYHNGPWPQLVKDSNEARVFQFESIAIGVAACSFGLPIEGFVVEQVKASWPSIL